MTQLAAATGGVVLLPTISACTTGGQQVRGKMAGANDPGSLALVTTVPLAKPTSWDPIAFNKARGNAGAIPKSYLPAINGPDGVHKHLGKHLPYLPTIDASSVPAGMIPIMWGDPQKGNAKHPNAARGPANNNEGHWYNWIKIRRAVEGEAEEVTNSYPEWPGTAEQQKDHYIAFGGGEITADSGTNTIYLAKLPGDLKAGETVRIYAHCLTHGEYVDFLTIG